MRFEFGRMQDGERRRIEMPAAPLLTARAPEFRNYNPSAPTVKVQMRCREFGCGNVLDSWRHYRETVNDLWIGRGCLDKNGEPRQFGIVVRGDTPAEQQIINAGWAHQNMDDRTYVYRCSKRCPSGPRFLSGRDLGLICDRLEDFSV